LRSTIIGSLSFLFVDGLLPALAWLAGSPDRDWGVLDVMA